MLLKILCVWLVFWSLAAFIAMGADKRRARQGLWRVPEKTLFLLAALGGAPGAFLGMHLFHHKTKHWYFRLGLPLLVLLWAGLLVWLYCLI
jgi:uncharacterized membrane protein YsdA (DUF1294 family)